MKTIYYKAIIAFITITVLIISAKYLIVGKELALSYIADQDFSSLDFSYTGGLKVFDWFIVSSDAQKNNLTKRGYILPNVDFENNYLIVSRYKISKLFRCLGKNREIGVPNGRAIFDKETSIDGRYYLYLAPRIMLSQGVG